MRDVLRVFAAAVVCLLLLGTPALAQDAQQPVEEDRQGRVEGDIDRDSGEKKLTGCLTGSDDNYVLTAESGEKFRLHSDKDIDEHVNNMVEVKGSIDADRASDDNERVGVATEAGAEAITELNVNDIKTVSQGCNQAGAMGQTESQDSAAAGMATTQPDAPSQQQAGVTSDQSATGAQAGVTSDQSTVGAQAGVTSDQSASADQSKANPCKPGETASEHAAHAGSMTADQSAQPATTPAEPSADAGVAADQSAQAGVAVQEEEARVESDEAGAGAVDGDIDRDSGEKVWKGCLTGSEGNYLLTADSGEKFRLHSDKDINEHVNNMVEVKGSIDADRASDDGQAAGVTAEAGAEASVKEVNVNDIKTVSQGCNNQNPSENDNNN